MEYSRAALKQEVKQDLANTQPRAVLVTLVYLLLTFGLTLILEVGQLPLTDVFSSVLVDLQWMMEGLGSGSMAPGHLIHYVDEMDLLDSLKALATFGTVFGVLSAVVNWTLTYGYQGYCLSMVRRRNPGFTRLLCAFPKWGWVLLTGFLIGLFTSLWAILISILAVLAIAAVLIFVEGSWAITLTIVILLAAVAWMISITLRYSMANYILLDERVDALEAISRSKDMMRGRKGHLLVLELSFIGWVLLAGVIGSVAGGIATLVVGLFSADPYAALSGVSGGSIVISVVTELAMMPLLMWLQPYMVGSTAKFYNWMKHTDIAHGVWEGRYPKRRKPVEATSNTVKITPIADPIPETPVPEAPVRPAYEEPASAVSQSGTEQAAAPEEPTAPEQEAPGRPDYE